MATIEETYQDVSFAEIHRVWQDSARHPMIFSAHERDYTSAEFEKAVWDTQAMLRKLGEHIIATAGVRDDLTQSDQILIGSFDQRAFIDSQKMNHRFEVCADGRAVWLESRITLPQHLRRMDDTFFELLIGLRVFGTWTFQSLDGDDRRIKSSVYHLISDAHAEELSDFGSLVVAWPFHTGSEAVLALAPQAFAALHQLQYRLYRAEYQLRAGRKRS